MTELASRTMKARGESICPRCKTLVGVGNLIAQVDGKWLHVNCALGKKPPMIGWSSGQ